MVPRGWWRACVLGAAVLGAAACERARDDAARAMDRVYLLSRVDGAPVPTVVLREGSVVPVAAILVGTLEFTTGDTLKLVLRAREPQQCATPDSALAGRGGMELRQAMTAMFACEDTLARTVESRMAYWRRGDRLTAYARIPRAGGRDTSYTLDGEVRGDTVRLPIVIAELRDPATGRTAPHLARLEFVR